jgi:hypothetical protein
MDDMIGCAKRELLMRKRVYPRWVADDRMTQEKADQEIAFMAAILEHLLKVAGRREEKNERHPGRSLFRGNG